MWLNSLHLKLRLASISFIISSSSASLALIWFSRSVTRVDLPSGDVLYFRANILDGEGVFRRQQTLCFASLKRSGELRITFIYSA